MRDCPGEVDTILPAALACRIGKPMRLDAEHRIHPEEVRAVLDAVRREASRRGLIADDRGSVIERVTWWEMAKRGEGVVVVEVRTGMSR